MEEEYRVAINRMGRALQSNPLGNRDGGSKLTPAGCCCQAKFAQRLLSRPRAAAVQRGLWRSRG